MSNHTNKSKNLTDKNPKWERESAQIRKVQISLDFPDAADTLLRTLAAREHKAPSSMIREIVGMPSSPPKRARIGVSFNEQELFELGERYDVDPNNKAEIRRKLTEEVTKVLNSTDELAGKEIGNSTPSIGDHALNVSITELKEVSDSIHQRFQKALLSRKKTDHNR